MRHIFKRISIFYRDVIKIYLRLENDTFVINATFVCILFRKNQYENILMVFYCDMKCLILVTYA